MKCYKITRDEKNIAYTYSKDEAKEFCLINDCVYEKLDEDEVMYETDFSDKMLEDICGLLLPSYLIKTFKSNLSVLIEPLRITKGILMMSKKNCTKDEFKALSISLDVIEREMMDIIKMTIDESSYNSIRDEYEMDDLSWLTGNNFVL